MTEKEQKDFFRRVEGKKIQWHTWEKAYYCIPFEHDSFNRNTFYAVEYDRNGQILNNRRRLSISFGLTKNGWSFVDDQDAKQTIDKPISKNECTCPKHVWMNEGCKCGAIVPYEFKC